MNIGVEDLDHILALFRDSDFDELRLEVGDLKVHVRKPGAGNAAALAVEPPRVEALPAAPAPAAASPAPAAAPAPGAAAPAAAPEADVEVGDGEVAVHAEVSGVFYRSPSPTEDPFVEEGAPVKAGDTVGLVEVMKLFTSITAGQAGIIARILMENGAPVQRGDVLMTIRPGA